VSSTVRHSPRPAKSRSSAAIRPVPMPRLHLFDNRSSRTVITHTALNYTYDTLASAEWIMERPLNTATDHLDLLSNYHDAYMTNAYVLIENGTWVTAESASTIQLTMYNENWVDIDNNELSSAVFTGPTSITFDWHDFH
jgi:hypothetical protein